jgi:hypothetical protein
MVDAASLWMAPRNWHLLLTGPPHSNGPITTATLYCPTFSDTFHVSQARFHRYTAVLIVTAASWRYASRGEGIQLTGASFSMGNSPAMTALAGDSEQHELLAEARCICRQLVSGAGGMDRSCNKYCAHLTQFP